MEESRSNIQILKQWNIGSGWTLFLDRDGVVNERKIGSYIMMPDEFEFLPGVLQAFSLASRLFQNIIIVTNQQGVGKGIMTEHALEQIHAHMIEKVSENNGRIDAVYFSPFLESANHPMRKPNPGMAVQAARDFPQISFKRSVMLGDTASDMQFARSLGIRAVFIGNPEEEEIGNDLFDLAYPSFSDFVKDLNSLSVIQ